MQRQQTESYRDQYEYLADCFELLRKRGDAYNIRSEAWETERMVCYSESAGLHSERSHLLDLYRGLLEEVERLSRHIEHRKRVTEKTDRRFPLDQFIEDHGLLPEETWILLVLLHNESLGRNQARFTTGNEILNVLFQNAVTALKASKFLGRGATLIDRGLIRSVSDDENQNFLRAAHEVTEKTMHGVLGVWAGNSLDPTRLSKASCTSLAGSYRVVAPHVSLDQVVLSPDLRRGILEIMWQAREGKQLYREWGLDRVMEKGKGTVALFCGPPGTGKTMTAEAIAHGMGRPLHIVDFSELESKWIGETEKNIVSVFRDAEEAGAVLLLDEADAILASRLDGGHYNDRAYNRQVSILLTELEAFEGFCILTTNRSMTLDKGLSRRISARFTFDIPAAGERLRIWKSLLPGEMPLGKDIDLEDLAHRFPLSGGHIKNAILGAVRKAALRDGETARIRQSDFGEAAAAERKNFDPLERPIGFGGPVVPVAYRSA